MRNSKPCHWLFNFLWNILIRYSNVLELHIALTFSNISGPPIFNVVGMFHILSYMWIKATQGKDSIRSLLTSGLCLKVILSYLRFTKVWPLLTGLSLFRVCFYHRFGCNGLSVGVKGKVSASAIWNKWFTLYYIIQYQ